MSCMESAGTDGPRLGAERGVVGEMLAGDEEGRRYKGEVKEQDDETHKKERGEDNIRKGGYDHRKSIQTPMFIGIDLHFGFLDDVVDGRGDSRCGGG